jgi:hypothetical protein
MWMIDWLVLNANFRNISWREQILYNKFINYKTLKNEAYLFIKQSGYLYK